MKTISKIIASITVITTLISCAGDKNTNEDINAEPLIFPKGELGTATNFTGKAYHFGLSPSFTLKLARDRIGTHMQEDKF
jgi:hypothetical protein